MKIAYIKCFAACILLLAANINAFAYNDERSGPLPPPDFDAIMRNCESSTAKDWQIKCAPPLAEKGSSQSEIEAAHLRRLAYYFQMDTINADIERDAILAGLPSATALHGVARYEISLGHVNGQTDRIKLGLDYLAKSELLEPDNVDIMATRAWVLQYDGYIQDAAEMYQKILAVVPNNTLANKQLGEIYFENGHYKEALESFNAAATQLPANDYVRCRRAQSYEKLEQYKKAYDDYKNCLENFAGDPTMQIAYAKTQAQIGDFEGSLKTYNYLIENPRMIILQEQFGAQLRMSRGIAYLALGTTEKAAGDLVEVAQSGNERYILQMRLFLRANGVSVPISRTFDQELVVAIKKCLILDECKFKILYAI